MKKFLIFLTVTFTLIAFGCNSTTDSTTLGPIATTTSESTELLPNPDGIELLKLEAEIIEEINKVRKYNKLSTLKVCKKSINEAKKLAQTMQVQGRIPELTGFNDKKTTVLIQTDGNLIDEVLEPLKNGENPVALSNMLKPTFTCIGVEIEDPGYLVIITEE